MPDGLSATAWAAITTQIAAGPYRAYPGADGRYASANPALADLLHGRRSHAADPRDRDAAPWQWGLRLHSYGFTALQPVPAAPVALQPTDQRMTYQWDDVLTEWWQNGTHGLEQGITVHRRPVDGVADGPLRVLLDVQVALHATPVADGFAFRTAAGEPVLTYTKLSAADATGRPLCRPRWTCTPGRSCCVSTTPARSTRSQSTHSCSRPISKPPTPAQMTSLAPPSRCPATRWWLGHQEKIVPPPG